MMSDFFAQLWGGEPGPIAVTQILIARSPSHALDSTSLITTVTLQPELFVPSPGQITAEGGKRFGSVIGPPPGPPGCGTAGIQSSTPITAAKNARLHRMFIVSPKMSSDSNGRTEVVPSLHSAALAS
ncbi:MAG: hypothetical protein DHS20C15_25890 [Planctomycetota bacterium]|nr:MAG: hypothetical protein DHS20C15_25890 [Planctomycetota bacterium]